MTQRSVVIIGKNRLAVDCMATILEAGDRVVLAVADANDDGRDGWQPSFRAAALRLGIDTVAPANVNDAGFVAEVDDLSPDYLLSFQAPQILKPPLIATGRIAALNLHFGPLPRYRGVAPIAWAIINGEPATGVTIHHISPGIDDGDIVVSAEVPIGATDTGRELYDRCSQAGIALFASSWAELRSGSAVSRPQDPDHALYYNRHSIDFSRRRIVWHQDAERIANWVRAMIFPPFQFPCLSLAGEEYQIGMVTWDRGSHARRPGQILGLEGSAVLVAAPGGRLALGSLRRGDLDLGPAELSAAGFAAGAQLDPD